MGPEALVSVVVGAAVTNEATVNSVLTEFEIATVLAFEVGILLIILSILKAGFVDHILSGYLLTGFILGVSNLIMIDQIPELLGLDLNLTQSVW